MTISENDSYLSSSNKNTIQKKKQQTAPTMTEYTKRTLLSQKAPLPSESLTTPLFHKFQRCSNKNCVLKEEIQKLAA